MVNCQLRNDFKGRARKMGVFEGGGGGGGVDLALDLRIFGMVSKGGAKKKVIDTIPKILKTKGQVNPPPSLRLRTRPFFDHAP